MGATRTYKHGSCSRTHSCTTNSLRLATLSNVLFTTIYIVFVRPLLKFFGLASTRACATTESCALVAYKLVLFSCLGLALAKLSATRKSSHAPLLTGFVKLTKGVVLSPLLVLNVKPFPELRITKTTVTAMDSRVLIFIIVIVHVQRSELRPGILRRLGLLSIFPGRCCGRVFEVKFPATVRKDVCYFVSVVLAHVISNCNTTTVTARHINKRVRSMS